MPKHIQGKFDNGVPQRATEDRFAIWRTRGLLLEERVGSAHGCLSSYKRCGVSRTSTDARIVKKCTSMVSSISRGIAGGAWGVERKSGGVRGSLSVPWNGKVFRLLRQPHGNGRTLPGRVIAALDATAVRATSGESGLRADRRSGEPKGCSRPAPQATRSRPWTRRTQQSTLTPHDASSGRSPLSNTKADLPSGPTSVRFEAVTRRTVLSSASEASRLAVLRLPTAPTPNRAPYMPRPSPYRLLNLIK